MSDVTLPGWVGRRRRAVLALVLALAPAGLAAGDLLDGNRAFPLRAEFDGRTVIVRYDVAPGYYLYRNKLRFALETPSARLAPPVLPKGTMTEDEFFGRVEIYRGALEIRLPLVKGSATPETIVLLARSQGCADAGVCYPPRDDRLALVRGGPPVTSTSPAIRRSLLDELQREP